MTEKDKPKDVKEEETREKKTKLNGQPEEPPQEKEVSPSVTSPSRRFSWRHKVSHPRVDIIKKLKENQFVAVSSLSSLSSSSSSVSSSSGVTFAGNVARIVSSEELLLHEETDRLRKEINRLFHEVQSKKGESAKYKLESEKLQEKIDELQNKEQLRFILDRLAEEPRDLLLKSEGFREKFFKHSIPAAYIMSIDIRRSTDLMLKARRPQLYADFITGLCADLREIILGHNGIYDKFTGDGILAFFPDFYSGPDAGYYAIKAATESHDAFAAYYQANRACFSSVLKGAGLGIGIDLGEAHLVALGDGLTVVGTPVVYACRMSGAEAGQTLLNQPAYEEVSAKYRAFCTIEETEIPVKHEGLCVAYAVRLNENLYEPEAPGWHAFRQSTTEGGGGTKASE